MKRLEFLFDLCRQYADPLTRLAEKETRKAKQKSVELRAVCKFGIMPTLSVWLTLLVVRRDIILKRKTNVDALNERAP